MCNHPIVHANIIETESGFKVEYFNARNNEPLIDDEENLFNSFDEAQQIAAENAERINLI